MVVAVCLVLLVVAVLRLGTAKRASLKVLQASIRRIEAAVGMALRKKGTYTEPVVPFLVHNIFLLDMQMSEVLAQYPKDRNLLKLYDRVCDLKALPGVANMEG